MSERGEIWGLVLAAGDGTRLHAVTVGEDGGHRPKQFCALVDERTLLRSTLDRMTRLLPRRRIVVVVAAAHRKLWQRELADWPAENVVVQPENRGTAAGLLLPLLTIAGRDPEARVVVAPSDHHVADERRFLASIADALSIVERPLERVVLLGIEPDGGDGSATGYGWIVPHQSAIGTPLAVERFVEKPVAFEAANLKARGALWNSFVLVSRIEALFALYVAREPELLHQLTELVLPRRPHADRERALEELYRRLEPRDFSSDLLAGSESSLALLPVPPCGWTDLGTPERLARCIEMRNSRIEVRAALPATAGYAFGRWNVSTQLA